jgi:regulator of replication initiation timing
LSTKPDPVIADLEGRVSALTVQRDAALRELARVETNNQRLQIHQDELRGWLAEMIGQWEEAHTDVDRGVTAHKIHQRAKEILRIADGFRQ